MSGKGAKGLIMGKASAANKDKDNKKKPISRSSRAGLQVSTSDLSLDLSLLTLISINFTLCFNFLVWLSNC